MILIAETSSLYCSAAIADANGNVLKLLHSGAQFRHAEELPVMVQSLIQEFESIAAVAVSAGPGSYTGLRIGTSLAKGICYAMELPLISCNALFGMAKEASKSVANADTIVAMLDARRNDVYLQEFAMPGFEITAVEAKTIVPELFDSTQYGKILICGNSNEKCAAILGDTSIQYIPLEPRADYLAQEAASKFSRSEFEDTAYFEPFYLKDFIPGVAKKTAL